MKLRLTVGSCVLFGLTLFVLPTVSNADTVTGIAQLANCSGADCSACNVVYMANGIIKWLIGILCIIFAVLLAIAGVKLVTSGGNPGALDAAKSSFTNAIIGFIIVLAAWLVVDTIIRSLVGNGGRLDNGGDVSGWLLWSEVTCQTQTKPADFSDYVETFWPGDPSGQFSNSKIVSEASCAPVPAGNLNCTALEASCRAAGNEPIKDTTNPVDHKISCVKVDRTPAQPIAGGGSVGCAGGTCVPLTIPCSAHGCNIAPDMVSRLAAMHAAAAVSGARVTEAMPASRVHKSACHSNGTCIDYSKAGGMTSAEVIRVISAARSNGLRPVYEVVTQSQKDALVAAGAPASSITVLGNWISAPHFSIYGS